MVGTSISFTTLHSHHELKWNHAGHQADTGHCVTEDTNLCPISGYLFNADIAAKTAVPALSVDMRRAGTAAESQHEDPFSARRNARSPPALG